MWGTDHYHHAFVNGRPTGVERNPVNDPVKPPVFNENPWTGGCSLYSIVHVDLLTFKLKNLVPSKLLLPNINSGSNSSFCPSLWCAKIKFSITAHFCPLHPFKQMQRVWAIKNYVQLHFECDFSPFRIETNPVRMTSSLLTSTSKQEGKKSQSAFILE